MPVKNKRPAKRKKKPEVPFDQSKDVRAIARERLGPVKASRVILPKAERPKAERKAKHKTPVELEEET